MATVYANKHSHRTNINVRFCLLIPHSDEKLKNYISDELHNVEVIEGDEQDVLGRYVKMQMKHNADYVVRITSDCPLIPPTFINHFITKAVNGSSDYFTNTWPGYETYFDGSDVEVISARLIHYMDAKAIGDEREHVTTHLKKNVKEYPREYKVDHAFNYIDISKLKLSIDTMEDFRRVKNVFESNYSKKDKWGVSFGFHSAHRF